MKISKKLSGFVSLIAHYQGLSRQEYLLSLDMISKTNDDGIAVYSAKDKAVFIRQVTDSNCVSRSTVRFSQIMTTLMNKGFIKKINAHEYKIDVNMFPEGIELLIDTPLDKIILFGNWFNPKTGEIQLKFELQDM